MKKNIMLACLMAMALGAQAQQGGITQDMLNQIKSSYKHTPADKAIYNAMAETSIAVLAKIMKIWLISILTSQIKLFHMA